MPLSNHHIDLGHVKLRCAVDGVFEEVAGSGAPAIPGTPLIPLVNGAFRDVPARLGLAAGAVPVSTWGERSSKG